MIPAAVFFVLDGRLFVAAPGLAVELPRPEPKPPEKVFGWQKGGFIKEIPPR